MHADRPVERAGAARSGEWDESTLQLCREWVRRNNKKLTTFDPDEFTIRIAAKTLKHLGLPSDGHTPFDLNDAQKLEATVHTIANRHLAELIGLRIKESERINRLCREWVRRNNRRVTPLDPDEVTNAVASKTLKFLGLSSGRKAPFDLSDMQKLEATVNTIGKRHVAEGIRLLKKERERLPTVSLDEARDYQAPDSTPIDDMCDAERGRAVEDAIRQLPIELRGILYAFKSGKSLRESAEDSRGKFCHQTVAVRLGEAFELVRDSLRERNLM